MNIVVLRGHLSSAPVHRSLESGSMLVTLEVSTSTPAGTASVPVAWFDPPRLPDWEAGEEVVVTGQVRRRFFRAASGTQSRTEVVAVTVMPARHAARVGRAIGAALAEAGVDPTGPRSAAGLRSV
ncbi:MAG: hypothetical protein ACKOA2_05010 [Ilumatobacteraceae bacterium]